MTPHRTNWWTTNGTRIDAYLLTGILISGAIIGILLGILARIIILEAGVWLPILIIGGFVVLVILMAEQIHASHRKHHDGR